MLLWVGMKSLGCFCGAVHLLGGGTAPHSQELLALHWVSHIFLGQQPGVLLSTQTRVRAITLC